MEGRGQFEKSQEGPHDQRPATMSEIPLLDIYSLDIYSVLKILDFPESTTENANLSGMEAF